MDMNRPVDPGLRVSVTAGDIHKGPQRGRGLAKVIEMKENRESPWKRRLKSKMIKEKRECNVA